MILIVIAQNSMWQVTEPFRNAYVPYVIDVPYRNPSY